MHVVLIVLLLCYYCPCHAQATAAKKVLLASFTYSGAATSFTVPTGVSSLEVSAWGGAGDHYGSGVGGLGGHVHVSGLGVRPGQTLYVFVGGGKGNTYNGGGIGFVDPYGTYGNGGGATDLRSSLLNTNLTSRLLVAGGGGGAGQVVGGSGGGMSANAGATYSSAAGQGGGGGTQSSGGGGSTLSIAGTTYTATAGSLGSGGAGSYNGGGGGGGYWGGGGGLYSSGGGGGSSYVISSANVMRNMRGVQSPATDGNGYLNISISSCSSSYSLTSSGCVLAPTATPTTASPTPKPIPPSPMPSSFAPSLKPPPPTPISFAPSTTPPPTNSAFASPSTAPSKAASQSSPQSSNNENFISTYSTSIIIAVSVGTGLAVFMMFFILCYFDQRNRLIIQANFEAEMRADPALRPELIRVHQNREDAVITIHENPLHRNQYL